MSVLCGHSCDPMASVAFRVLVNVPKDDPRPVHSPCHPFLHFPSFSLVLSLSPVTTVCVPQTPPTFLIPLPRSSSLPRFLSPLSGLSLPECSVRFPDIHEIGLIPAILRVPVHDCRRLDRPQSVGSFVSSRSEGRRDTSSVWRSVRGECRHLGQRHDRSGVSSVPTLG